jgi:hypothetical protein
MLYCSIPNFVLESSESTESKAVTSVADVFNWFSQKKKEKHCESYAITQTTLEQIFVRVAGEGNENEFDDKKTV